MPLVADRKSTNVRSGNHPGAALRTAVLDYEGGLLIVAQLGAGDCLAILAAPEANVGSLLYDLRQHRPALSALL